MNTKLTLSIESQVIEKAKKYAKKQGRSLSNIVEEYLKSISEKPNKMETKELHPLVEELSGSVKFYQSNSYKEIVGQAKIEKYTSR